MTRKRKDTGAGKGTGKDLRRRGFLATVAAAAAALALARRRSGAETTPRGPPRWIGHD